MRRSIAPCLAFAAAVSLHALGSWWLSGGAGAARASGHVWGAHRAPGELHAGRSLNVRLSNAVLPALDDAASQAPPIDAAVDERLSSSAAQTPAAEAVTDLPSSQAALADRYLSADQLDRPPSPEPGFILDEAAFNEVGAARLVLRLWVSAQGRIDRVTVLRVEPSGAWVDRAIRPLPDTRMRPGELAGQPVASTLVVELSASIETFR